MINVLCSNILDDGSTDTMKEASLEAIGYICQDIVSPFLNTILRTWELAVSP